MNKDLILIQLKNQNCEALPKRASQFINEIMNTLEEADKAFFDVELNNQQVISVCNQISKHIKNYSAIPKHDAITLIVKEGKTAKELVIESIEECVVKVKSLISSHSQVTASQFNNDFAVVELKDRIDFFNL